MFIKHFVFFHWYSCKILSSTDFIIDRCPYFLYKSVVFIFCVYYNSNILKASLVKVCIQPYSPLQLKCLQFCFFIACNLFAVIKTFSSFCRTLCLKPRRKSGNTNVSKEIVWRSSAMWHKGWSLLNKVHFLGNITKNYKISIKIL